MKKTFPLIFGLLLVIGLASCAPDGSHTTSDGDITDLTTTDDLTYTGDPDAEFTVTFDLNYFDAVGTPDPQIVKGGQLVTKPSDPTRDDYTFLHWSEGMYGSVMWDFEKNIVIKDMTLYAAWEYTYVEPEPESKTFYVRVPSYWLAEDHTVSLYAWDDYSGNTNNSWPGEKMNHVEDQIFSYKISEEYSKIIFARCTSSGGDPADGSKAQTFDLDITNFSNPDFDFYWINDDVRYGDNKCNGRWGIYPDEPDELPPDPGSLYYVKIPVFWENDSCVASVYFWGSSGDNSWPGQKMTPLGEQIYSFEIPDKYINVIFARVTASGVEPTRKAQTIDLIKPTDGRNYFIVDTTEQYMPSKAGGK